MSAPFDLQGHRGARGLKPENTLPGFEAALNLGIGSIETDVRLTADGVPVLFHPPHVTDQLCYRVPNSPPPYPCHRPLVSGLTLAQLRNYRAECNPDPRRFPDQDATPTPLAVRFAASRGIDPYTPPALPELFAFASCTTPDCEWCRGR
jgi:glycerophosphoryl diester phosphodiesterase